MKYLRKTGCFLFAITALVVFSGNLRGQPLQREWVRTYFNIQSSTNQAIEIAVTPDGHVVVAGSSENAGGDLDYQIIKYRRNGDEAWKARYGSVNGGNDQLRDMAIDPAGNVIVTGTSSTVKYSPTGVLMWQASLPGRAVIANANYVYVTGISDTDIATVQLENNNTNGREIWRRVIDGRNQGIDIGQAITLDANGNVYVAGQEDYAGCVGGVCSRLHVVVSYSPAGSQRWFGRLDAGHSTVAHANSVLVHPDGSVYVYGALDSSAFIGRLDQAGNPAWGSIFFGKIGTKMVLDERSKRITVTGRRGVDAIAGVDGAFVIVFEGNEANAPKPIWRYWSANGGWTEGSDIRQDSLGTFFVTGYVENEASLKDFFLAKLNGDGQQLGVDRYRSPNAGSNFGTALAIDPNDNVYVTGYVQNTQGGSEFVTIKYSAAPKIEKKTSGAIHIEFHTAPGQQYALEATTNFFDWQSLITNTADANGVVQFDDTAAATIPYRFYRGRTSP